jgi:hypothetical protein
MSFFDNITSFITDRGQRLSVRATVLIITLALIIFADNVCGFSYYYNRQRQLEQLQSIAALLKDSSISLRTKENLRYLETQTLIRRNILDKSMTFAKNLSTIGRKLDSSDKKALLKTERNEIVFFISTSGIYALVLILAVPIIFFTDKKTPFFKLVASLFLSAVIMAFTCWFNYWMIDLLLPYKIWGSWTWNYIMNVLIQLGLLIGLWWALKIGPGK